MAARISKMLRVLIYLILFFIAGLVFLGYKSYDFFYYPTSNNYGAHPANKNQPYDDIYFTSTDGTKLHGWFVPATVTPVKGTVIQVHGNAGNITGHWSFVDWLPERGFNVFVFDYRGYGESAGKPEPQGLLEDTQSAINYVSSRADVDSDKLVIFAQSLGGNNALAAIGDALEKLDQDNKTPLSQEERQFLTNVTNIKALTIDSTFYSYAAIAHDKVKGSGLFFSDRYSAEGYIDKMSPIPILFIHNTGDGVIPYRHSQRLYDKAMPPKKLILVEGGGHLASMISYGATYHDTMTQFFERALGEQE